MIMVSDYGLSLISSDCGGIAVLGWVGPLVALITTKNCLNWVKLSVKGSTCCNLVLSDCNSDVEMLYILGDRLIYLLCIFKH